MRVLEEEGKARLDWAKCLGKSSWEMGEQVNARHGRKVKGRLQSRQRGNEGMGKQGKAKEWSGMTRK